MEYTSQSQHKPSARTKKTLNIKNSHVCGLAPENYHDRNHHWREAVLLMVPTEEKKIPTQTTLEGVVNS
jgi:hypothetical protein